MRKYEVDRIHNSKDNEIYQIAQSVEQKVRTGMLMPDYEMGQKPFHHWGDVILNYLNPENISKEGLNLNTNKIDLFETTFTTEEKMDGEWYVTTIKVDSQNLKLNKKQDRSVGVVSFNYAVNFEIQEYGSLTYYNYKSDEFVGIIKDGDKAGSERDSMHIVNYKNNNNFIIKLNLLQNKSIKVRSTTTFINPKKINAYNTFRDESNGGNISSRGLIISHKRKWILIEDNNLDNICVKHGGMKYVGGQETIWKLTRKNVYKPSTYRHRFGRYNHLGIWYNGYTKPRFGAKGDRNGNDYRYLTWIKCYWLDGDFVPCEFKKTRFESIDIGTVTTILSNVDIVRLLHKRRKRVKPDSDSGNLHVHFLKANIRDNCFELWNFTIAEHPGTHETMIKPIFLKNISPEEGYNILHNRNKQAETLWLKHTGGYKE